MNAPDIVAQHIQTILDQQALIKRLSWNPSLNMYNQAGLMEAIRTLDPSVRYTVVYADIDRLKTLNSVTGNHFQTNRYLCNGLRIRKGEIAGQMFGDEIVFLIAERQPGADRRRRGHSPEAFVARIARQLAGQPLTSSERYALAAAHGVPVTQAKLSATFATQSGVTAGQIHATIERLSCDVLAMKAQRDASVRVV